MKLTPVTLLLAATLYFARSDSDDRGCGYVDILVEDSDDNLLKVISALAKMQDGAAAELAPEDFRTNLMCPSSEWNRCSPANPRIEKKIRLTFSNFER